MFEWPVNDNLRPGSEAAAKIVSIGMGIKNMLARRFTIVCLLTALFAMGFARIVAQSADSPAEWRTNLPKSCATYGVDCRTSPDRVAWRP
jgi:hypothetical protein